LQPDGALQDLRGRYLENGSRRRDFGAGSGRLWRMTITKAMTINGDGDLASTTFSGANAVNVVAGANDVVVLRNLSFNGTGGGLNGVRLISGGMLVVENRSISGFTQNGIEIASSATTAPRRTITVRKNSGDSVSGTFASPRPFVRSDNLDPGWNSS
jgi:hypothetical protein